MAHNTHAGDKDDAQVTEPVNVSMFSSLLKLFSPCVDLVQVTNSTQAEDEEGDPVAELAAMVCRQWGMPSFDAFGHGSLQRLLQLWEKEDQMPQGDQRPPFFAEPLLKVCLLVFFAVLHCVCYIVYVYVLICVFAVLHRVCYIVCYIVCVLICVLCCVTLCVLHRVCYIVYVQICVCYFLFFAGLHRVCFIMCGTLCVCYFLFFAVLRRVCYIMCATSCVLHCYIVCATSCVLHCVNLCSLLCYIVCATLCVLSVFFAVLHCVCNIVCVLHPATLCVLHRVYYIMFFAVLHHVIGCSPNLKYPSYILLQNSSSPTR
jgi:hypothetical protein